MEPENSSPHSQEPATFVYSVPDQSSPCPEDPFSYFPPIYTMVLSGLFPSGFPTATMYVPLLSRPMHATCPTSLILLDLITGIIFGEEYRSLSSSLCSLLYSPVMLSLLGPNILISTLFSYTLSLHSSIHVSNKVSHPWHNYSSAYLNLNIFG